VKLPITQENLREWFPSPYVENPLAGDPWWQLQSLGLLCALQFMRLIPAGDLQQQALIELRRGLDTGLLAIPAPSDEEIQRRRAQSLAPWCPSPFPVVDAMLNLAALTPDDVLLDLGSGDGRIVLEAAARGARSIGVEIDAAFVSASIERVSEDPAYARASFRHENALEADLSEATVITCYLVSTSMAVLSEKFRTLRPGTRIISHAFAMANWAPTRVVHVDGVPVFLWTV